MSWFDIIESQISPNPPRLTVEEAILIYEEAELNELLHVAHIRRKQMIRDNEVTYLVDRNINYTNV